MAAEDIKDDRVSRLASAIRVIPDFPKPGIMFHDITTLLLDTKAFKDTMICSSRDIKIKISQLLRMSLNSESRHEALPRITAPNPFHRQTEERGAEKERSFLTEVVKKQWEEERARVPKAKSYPYTTDYPVAVFDAAIRVVLQPPKQKKKKSKAQKACSIL